MTFAPGSRIGSYEILSVLGEGGMGRVYRARDSKLQRHVAIKVLPEGLATDPDRIARFEREARTLAALNHPHIAQIYGTEQSGDTHALVMELVDGEDLSARIARGPMPWPEAAPIARQIAEALEAAHEQGIIHRDLKPANIKLTPDGIVKVLDFGLAKAVAPESGNAGGTADPANSPTITSPAGVTQAGIILGTAAYMSPEQAKGRPADRRSDVWAFGCVLYEMTTGKRAFPGDDVMETLSAVIRTEPDLAALPADVPGGIRAVIARCLVKDRRARVPEIAVVRYALETADGSSAAPTPASLRSGNVWPWAFAALAGIIAIATVAIPRLSAPAVEPAPVIRSTIATPGAVTVGFSTIAVSRQGTAIAYPSTLGRIMLRRLADMEPRPLQGTEGGANPFFSPDGEWLGFFADGKLRKISIAGSPAQVLADAPSGRGGTWGPDGTIVFAPAPEAGLSMVSADGGAVTALTQLAPNERAHRWPHLLPDGRTVLFTIQPAGKLYDDAVVAAVAVGGGAPRVVVEGGTSAQYAESGHLIYARAGTLFAVPFDPVTARGNGTALAVLDNVRTNSLNGALPVGVSASGLLAYLPGENVTAPMSLVAANRNGPGEVLLDRRLMPNASMRLSPDGRRLALTIFDGQADIWILELESRGIRRVTSGAGSESFPVWSPDGSRLYYSSNTGGVTRTVTKAVEGSDTETDVSSIAFFPMSISPDGRTLAARAITRTSYDVVTVDIASGKITAVAALPANETEPSFSPDGRLIAYQSDESGTNEVFVQEFPSGTKWQVTTGGGTEPRWTTGGREIAYRNASTIYAVPVTPRPFSKGIPQPIFSGTNLLGFDITADGKRILAVQQNESLENPHLVLVSGWFEELKVKMRPTR
ncbi:MAG TPA: protein kinase [Vicinamibacterales bacterium]|nr:protein kinase [Vicinamibacterales bacterium]